MGALPAKDEKRLREEFDAITFDGIDRCTHAVGKGSARCMRVVGHVGCHYTHDAGWICRWGGNGKRMAALYPKRRTPPPDPGAGEKGEGT